MYFADPFVAPAWRAQWVGTDGTLSLEVREFANDTAI